MIVSIHQPNYLPWSGFFHKISLCDVFVLLDDVPFSKNSYQNRCRIKTNQGAAWLTVPVVTSGLLGQSTDRVRIDPHSSFTEKHRQTVGINYKRAPYYEQLNSWLSPVYEASWELLADMTSDLIVRAAADLGIKTKLVRSSTIRSEGVRSEKLCSICTALGATEYISGPSGRDYLDLQPFKEHGVAVTYHSFTPPTYPQLHGEFMPGLSIIDLIASCGPESSTILSLSGGKSE